MGFNAKAATGKEPLLDGKIAVITGGGRGIGRSAVELFTDAGARVVACDLDSESLGELQDVFGDKVDVVQADLTTVDGAERLARYAGERHGRVDVLYNNAGVGTLTDAFLTAHETPYEIFERTVRTNAWSTFAVSREVIPYMLDGGGSIINVASIYGLVAGAGSVSYITSKGAILAMTRSLAFDYGSRGIRVNVICPGHIDTRMSRDYAAKSDDPDGALQRVADMHLLGRIGRPEEVAAAALWLGSDASTFMTGSVVTVDGGYTTQ